MTLKGRQLWLYNEMAGFKHTKAQLSGRMKPTKVKKQDASQKRKRADVSREKLAQSIADLVSVLRKIMLLLSLTIHRIPKATSRSSMTFHSPTRHEPALKPTTSPI